MKDLEVRIHSHFADHAGASIKLWYVCRALSDSGRSVINVNDVAEALEVSPRTIRHWMKECKEKGYFRSIIKQGAGIYVVYYAALTKLTKGWGPTASILLSDLKNYKTCTAEIQAQSLQAQSRYCAMKYHGKKALKPEDLFNNPSEISTGVLHVKGSLLMVKQSFILFGASQVGIASRLGRSISTVARRLKDTQKVRLAQRHRLNYTEKRILAEEWDPQVGRFFFYKKGLFKLHTNVYYPSYTLHSTKRRTSQVREDFFNEVMEERFIAQVEEVAPLPIIEEPTYPTWVTMDEAEKTFIGIRKYNLFIYYLVEMARICKNNPTSNLISTLSQHIVEVAGEVAHSGLLNLRA